MKSSAIVEIPKNHHYKYELVSGVLVLDRPLNQPIPFNYGYIPNTLCDDGDALDIFILSKFPILPKTQVDIKIIGVYKCKDGKYRDDKLIGVLVGENIKDEYDEIKNYLTTYKKNFKVISYRGKKEAVKILANAQKHWYNKDSRG